MKRNLLILSLFCITTALFITPVSAGDITFQTESNGYTFMTGDEAQIPVIVNNELGRDVKGTLTGIIKYRDDSGSYITYNSKQQTFTVFSDMTGFNFMTGTKSLPETIYADIYFDFTTDRAYRISLENIKITFTDNQEDLKSGTEEPVSAIQAEMEVDPNKLKETNNNPSPAAPTNSGENTDISKKINEDTFDTEALKESASAEIKKLKAIKESLSNEITSDELFKFINESLRGQNYYDQIMTVTPKGSESGDFLLEYRSKTADIITVSGNIQNGSIAYIRQESEISTELPAVLLQNETFQSSTEYLSEKKYELTHSVLNITPQNQQIELKYNNSLGSVRLTALIENDSVAEVILDKDPVIPYYQIAALILVAALITAGAAYRILSKNRAPEIQILNSIEKENNKKSPSEILDEAVRKYEDGMIKEACIDASLSLRQHISEKYGYGDEITDIQCLKLTLMDKVLNDKCKTILSKTEHVRFAGEPEHTVTPDEFINIAGSIKEIIIEFKIEKQ